MHLPRGVSTAQRSRQRTARRVTVRTKISWPLVPSSAHPSCSPLDRRTEEKSIDRPISSGCTVGLTLKPGRRCNPRRLPAPNCRRRSTRWQTWQQCTATLHSSSFHSPPSHISQLINYFRSKKSCITQSLDR